MNPIEESNKLAAKVIVVPKKYLKKDMKRKKIYKVIDTERDYQDSKWGMTDDPNYVSYEPSQFIIDIEVHLNKAKIANYAVDKKEVMHEMRKIAALAVKCGEVHTMPKRKLK